ncbi:M56 family metallopeptidase [Chondrinema litorale]|uniref:M56 family metallopeptidase n=1 Tax=Chondrinema litorale TaxID=2994555 RepID=UPI002543317F|nr:M56 family metallopeptidase [Chondrinema litorale]UZR99894.1 M56 family metallopeptidase [Chondrinema litorale]
MNSVFNYFLEASICMCFSFVFFKLLLEKLTFFNWNRFVFWLLILASVGVPLLSISVEQTVTEFPEKILDGIHTLENSTFSEQLNQGQIFNWQIGLFIIYIIGVFIAFFRLSIQLYLVFSKLNIANKVKCKSYQLAIYPNFKYASFFNYIFLPSYVEQDVEQQQILLHESVHVKLYHSVDVMAMQLLKVIFWFNPVLILLDKRLREIHEFQADFEVIKSYSQIDYSKLLIKLAAQKHSLHLMNFFNFSQTQKRIVMMNKSNSKKLLKGRFLFAIPLIGFFMMLFSFDFQGINQKDLEGSWTGTNLSFKQTQGPDVAAMVEGGKSLHIGGILMLKDDHTYQIKEPSGSINGKGNWKMDNTSTFTNTDANGEVTTYKIIDLESDKLITTHKVSMDTPNGKVVGEITLSYKR